MLNKNYETIFIWAFLLLVVSWCILYENNVGSDNINSIFAKKNMTFQGYVYAFPDISYAKNYRVVADIEKDEDGYYINKIYFGNGGFIEFDSSENEAIYKNTKKCQGSYLDDQDRHWCFRFYGEQIK